MSAPSKGVLNKVAHQRDQLCSRLPGHALSTVQAVLTDAQSLGHLSDPVAKLDDLLDRFGLEFSRIPLIALCNSHLAPS